MAGEVKILSDEQFNILMSDIAQLIGQVQKIEQSFNPKKLKQEILNEFKIALSKNSLFESLKKEGLELELNLIALRNVREEFYECKRKSERGIIITGLGGLFAGGLFVTLTFWLTGQFG